ncbi:hypothetical protein QYE76_029306 [Lolium multiflorum]|uniref:Aminotransferase-like plant mobile domain-containing protein n=1 Tax=Lolium multiflorum TaxID=4521 RepID=A0AAD8QMK8_LOLMU|nr:hypothetical protein QYE76_029306 [Lolium multiflorum]
MMLEYFSGLLRAQANGSGFQRGEAADGRCRVGSLGSTAKRGRALVGLARGGEAAGNPLQVWRSAASSDQVLLCQLRGAFLMNHEYVLVDWEPYGTYYLIGAGMADINPKCVEEARFWRMRCPLICMWLVEYHQPHRVMRQFGLYQECPPQWQDTDHALHRLDRQRQRKITNWPVHHRGHVTVFQHCLEAVRNVGHVEIVPHDLTAFNNYLKWFHQSTRIELVKPAYDDQILDDPIEFDEVAQSQHDIYARKGRSTSIASELNFVNTARKMRRLANLLGCRVTEIEATSSSEDAEIPDDDTIPSQGIVSQRKKQAIRSAYQLKPRGKAPKRYTPDDYVNRGKKVVIQEDETPPRRSTLRRMRNDEPLSLEEEEQQE